MTLPFKENVINDKPLSAKSFANPNFVGYLNPVGDIISSGYKPDGFEFGWLGPHYINWGTDLFLQYMPLVAKKKFRVLKSREQKAYHKKQTELRALLAVQSNKVNEDFLSQPWAFNATYMRLRLDLYRFFNNCYLNEDFFAGMGREQATIAYTELVNARYKEPDPYECFIRKNGEINAGSSIFSEYWPNEYNEFDAYFLECIKFLKDVFVQYLGYHSVERLPKTITTSSFKVYEEFYNYLLNGFTIIQIPKMIFDLSKKAYIEVRQEEFMIPESELRLKDEVETLKRVVPKEELYKFYR